MKRLEEIKKRLSGATPGPWEENIEYFQTIGPEDTLGEVSVTGPKNQSVCSLSYDTQLFQNCENNSLFVAHSRQDIEDLVKCVEIMKEHLEQIKRNKWESGKISIIGSEDTLRGKASDALVQVEEILK